MTQMKPPLIAKVETAIEALLLEVASHPLCHFSEKSLQVRLASKLLFDSDFSMPLPTNIRQRYKPQLISIEKDEARCLQQYYDEAYKTTPLQMEYGNNLPGPYRVDLAILNPDDIRRIETVQLQDADNKYLKPLVGIEFGTEKSGWAQMSNMHLVNDARKVSECDHGYIINVMRNTNFGCRSKGRHAEKQLRIDRFMESVQTLAQNQSSIVWIGMVVNIAFADITFLAPDGHWMKYELPQDTDQLARAIQARFSPITGDTC